MNGRLVMVVDVGGWHPVSRLLAVIERDVTLDALRSAGVQVVEIEAPRPPRLDGIREHLQAASAGTPSRGPAVRRKWPIRR